MEKQKTSNSQSDLEKEEWNWEEGAEIHSHLLNILLDLSPLELSVLTHTLHIFYHLHLMPE